MSDKRQDVVVLKNVRLSFPKLFKAEAAVAGGTPKFGAAFLIDGNTEQGKANLQALKLAQRYVAGLKWGETSEKVLKALEWDRQLIRHGDKATDANGDIRSGYEGMFWATASNDRRPKVLDRAKRPVAEEDNLFYGGCYVDAVISVYATNNKDKGGNGVFASLEIVRFVKDGESFGAPVLDEDDYLDDLGDDDDVSGSDGDDDDLV